MVQGRYVFPFSQLRMTDVDRVGGKNASLGELLSQLTSAGIRVPDGFATTAEAFRLFIKESGLEDRIAKRLAALDVEDVKALAEAGAEIRRWIEEAPFPAELEKQRLLSKLYCKTHASIVWHGNKLIFQAQFIQDRLDNV